MIWSSGTGNGKQENILDNIINMAKFWNRTNSNNSIYILPFFILLEFTWFLNEFSKHKNNLINIIQISLIRVFQLNEFNEYDTNSCKRAFECNKTLVHQ